jgi:methyl-accepting chemotaxis protein
MHSEVHTAAAIALPNPGDRMAQGPWWAWLALALVGLAAWQGGVYGTTGALLAAAPLVWWVGRGVAPPGAAGRTAAAGAAMGAGPAQPVSGVVVTDDETGDAGAMVRRVAPVWSRQLMVTREVSEGGMSQLLSAFSSMSDVLGTLTDSLENFQPAAAPGAVGEAIEAQRPALDALLQPLQRAFEQRDALLARLGDCKQAVGRLQQLSKEAREIGRHTRLVSFNANIEAHRGGMGGHGKGNEGGSQQVAAEVRVLAERVTAICNRMDLELGALSGAVGEAHRDGLLHDTSAEELRLETEQRARQAVQALLSSLGAAVHGAGNLREAGRELRHRLDDVFTHFQFGDRVAQMMEILAKDMTGLTEHLRLHPQPAPGDAQAWLKRLEASYTMEEQRSHHHGNQHVDRGSEVEFF